MARFVLLVECSVVELETAVFSRELYGDFKFASDMNSSRSIEEQRYDGFLWALEIVVT
jgi:hypothetical protein